MAVEDRKRGNLEFVASVLGVSRPTATNYIGKASFPEPDDQKKYRVYDVVRWHLLNLAPKADRCIPMFQAAELDQQEDLKTQEQILELRLKSHKVAKEVGQVCLPEHLRHVVGQFVSGVREIWQDAPGDLAERLDVVYAEFVRQMEVEESRLTEIGT